MIELSKQGFLHDRQVRANKASITGCDFCCFEPICSRHSILPEHRHSPKLFVECMAKYREDNQSVYFVNVK